MTATLNARLVRLGDCRRRTPPPRPTPATTFGATKLTARERLELGCLMRRAERDPREPNRFRAWDSEGLCACRLDRAPDPTRKAHGWPPTRSYGSSPCQGGIAARIEEEVAPCRRAFGQGAAAWAASRGA